MKHKLIEEKMKEQFQQPEWDFVKSLLWKKGDCCYSVHAYKCKNLVYISKNLMNNPHH
jgi:hypothetical protein